MDSVADGDVVKSVITGKKTNYRFSDLVYVIKTSAVTIVWVTFAYFLVFYAITGGIKRLVSAVEVTHVELFGVKVNIDQKTAALRERLSRDSDGTDNGQMSFALNMGLLNAATRRAEANASVIRGSRILWVDDEPENNTAVVDLLSQLGVNVVAVTENREAMNILEKSRFDVIVTDGSRPRDLNNPNGAPLVKCPLTYRSVPYNRKFASVKELNDRVLRGSAIPGGFRLVEEVAKREEARAASVADPENWANLEFYEAPPLYADITAPRIIMYSASNGDISYSPCVRTITRRTDYLFNSIISVLEETRRPTSLSREPEA